MHTAEVLNEETKDWESVYIKELQYDCDMGIESAITLNGVVDIPTRIANTLSFKVALPMR